MRRLRLRAVWLIVLPFFWFSEPTLWLCAGGAAIAMVGLWIRAWSAGTIHKDRHLTVTGPYAYVRNPLYVGSLFLGLGVAVAGGHWAWPAVFLLFYAAVYSRTMAGEVRLLHQLFPEDYPDYAGSVPGLFPRLTPYRTPRDDGSGGFRWSQYRRNREWEASLGAAAAFALLSAKAIWA